MARHGGKLYHSSAIRSRCFMLLNSRNDREESANNIQISRDKMAMGIRRKLKRSGRPKKKTDARDERMLQRLFVSDRRQTLADLTNDFNGQYASNISSGTVKRRLNVEGYKRHQVSKTIVIKPINREKKRGFIGKNINGLCKSSGKKVILVMKERSKLEMTKMSTFGENQMRD